MSVIKPPSPLTKNLKNQPKVFLAGSIEMGAAEDWQKTISNTLSPFAFTSGIKPFASYILLINVFASSRSYVVKLSAF